VQLGSIDNLMGQGSAQTTGNPTDLMIQGNGFLRVGTGTPGAAGFPDSVQYTRAGNLQINTQGYLTTASGQYILGYQTAAGGGPDTANNKTAIQLPAGSSDVAIGADGSIIRTTDGGAHWQSVKSPKNVSLFGIIFLDKNIGFTVGEFSTILATTDGGQNWTLAYGGNTGDFTVGPYFSIAFTDPQHGIACGLAGDLLATADGGKTWKVQKLPDTVAAYIVSEDSASKKLWAAGAGGRMFIADQSGQWKSIDRTAFHDITDLTFAGNLGVAVGLNGTILLTNNAGEQWQAVQ
jgi:photosystem II stability/assembly factor-like uncharacterized protein